MKDWQPTLRWECSRWMVGRFPVVTLTLLEVATQKSGQARQWQ
jgi:hypothetical protein